MSHTILEAIVVRDDSKKKSTNSRQMAPKRAVSKSRKPPPPVQTRKAPVRGRKGATEQESEPEDVGITENEEVDEREEAEEVPVRRASRPLPKTAAKKTLPPSSRAKKSGRFAKANATPVVDEEATESDRETSVTANTVQTDGEDDRIQILEQLKKGTAAAAKKTLPKKMTKREKEAQALAEKEIAETQYTPMDLDDEVVEREDDEVVSAQPPPKPASRKRSASVTQQPAAKKVTPSIAETLQGNTATEEFLRAQLGEMTRKFEDTDKRLKELTKLKYTDAEAALVEYKKVMEARIASMLS